MPTYLAIDLKSFYASVECIDRGLSPMDTHLVVANESRTEKTICLAASPALKSLGVPGRARLFEVMERVEAINAKRLKHAPGGQFTGSSHSVSALEADSSLKLEILIAPPRMAHYIECSQRIYQIYLKYVAPEDMHVYSIDEVFLDLTPYLHARGQTARAFAQTILLDVLRATGMTATAGIGSNLYLSKIAMDICAKRLAPDLTGARIAQLNETSYRRLLWSHRPLTDFWRLGKGYAIKLETHGMFTMGDIARQSIKDEDLLYRLFGVNAELLIDHAWGLEPCTIADIKSYRPQAHSVGSGQVLPQPYSFEQTRLLVREMADALALDLLDHGLVTSQLVLDVGYDSAALQQSDFAESIASDRYGRKTPKAAHGSVQLERQTASSKLIIEAAVALYEQIADPRLMARRLTLTAAQVVSEEVETARNRCEQLDLSTCREGFWRERERQERQQSRERRRQLAVLAIKKKYGKNAILLGTSLLEGATARERNRQIGGHLA